MKLLLPFAVTAVFLLLLLTPLADASAQGLVPCGTTENPKPCEVCDIPRLTQNLLNFFVFFSVIVATLMFTYAGILFLTVTTNPEQATKARTIFGSVFIGLVIVLTAWLVVDTILKAFVDESRFGPWNEIQCGPDRGSDVPSVNSGARPTVSAQPSTPQESCASCVSLPDSISTNGNACRTSTCQIDADLANRLVAFQERAASDQYNVSADSWRVSEAWPPTVNHQASCHYNGTCVDISFAPTAVSSPKNIQSFAEAAAGSQLRAIYEVQTTARKEQLEAGGVSNVIVVPGINREHFSVYCDTCAN